MIGNLLFIAIGIYIGTFVSKQLELYKVRKNLYTIKRSYEYRSSGEEWANCVRNWFELHPDEFKLIKLKIGNYKATLIYQSLTGKRLAFSTHVGKFCSPVEKIIENNNTQLQEKLA